MAIALELSAEGRDGLPQHPLEGCLLYTSLEQTLVYKGVPRAAVPDTPASDAETSADLPEDGDSFNGA